MSEMDDAWMRAMRRGDYAEALRISAHSLACRDPASCDDPDLPYHLRWVWSGDPVDGRHVLVRCYHGLGDTIQFARYLPLLRQRAGSVTVEMQPRLLPLFAHYPGFDRLIPFDPAAPAAPGESTLEIMELPLALGAMPQDALPPYLHVSPALLPKGTIGLCWRGGDWDEERSVPEQLFEPLACYPAITLVAEPTELPLLNSLGCPMDMMTTAALVAGVELVITIDTMIAHLAGAMNKPTWLLVKHDPDWRWAHEGETSHWYPSTRIYRQNSPGDWGEVIGRIASDLAERRAGDATKSGTGS